ncbi:uncharacterized protein [Watersipora subatra]|uniref:uncharacterized protein isoform X1 n=1 Tax=Watersipora subatra TaxID=2589382 RepID=UPI00355B28E7
MSQRIATLTLDSRRGVLGERWYRRSQSTAALASLSSRSSLVWRKEHSRQPSKLKMKEMNEVASKPGLLHNLPRATSPFHTWRQTKLHSKPEVKQATDRSYRHTYGDCESGAFHIEIRKDFLNMKQKSEVPNRCVLSSESPDGQCGLSNVVVTKIYRELHDEKPQGDRNCEYAIKNIRRATRSCKKAHLPIVTSLYNIHLDKSVRTVLSQESLNHSKAGETDAIKRPLTSERKYYSQFSGNLLKSRRRLRHGSTKPAETSYELLFDEGTSRSADVYNKLLTLRLANRQPSCHG